MSVTAAIFGCAGAALTPKEAAFFQAEKPWGFILFARNVETPDQVRRLTEELRQTLDRPDAPILVDQEGGRVQRLGPPHWRRYPPAAAYAALPAAERRDLARLGGRLIAHDLAAAGINVNCAPALDVPAPGADEVIGDRAFGSDPDEVALLGRAMAEGLIAGGVLPVIKHLPGHGRALADSHLELPVIEAGLADLDARDFAPFRALSDMPLAMTAHVVFRALDPKRPATLSRATTRRVIRRNLGFAGLLMTDDISMQALSGGLAGRARDAVAAGCDVVLHCTGNLAEMRQVARGAGPLKGKAKARAQSALARIPKSPEPFDVEAGQARFEAAFASRLAA